MKRLSHTRWLAMLLALTLIFAFSTQSTFGYIVAKTPSVVNTFKPFATYINGLILSKTVEHPYGADYVVPDAMQFDFELDFGREYANYRFSTTEGELIANQSGVVAVAIKPDGAIGFENVKVGTAVTVTELQNRNGFAVKDGTPSKQVVVGEDGAITLDYVNVYTPMAADTSAVTLTGEKVLEGREWQEGDEFAFVLEMKQGAQWVEVATETVTYDPANPAFNTFDFTAELQAVRFTTLGDHAFRIREQQGILEGMVYDRTVNHMAVTVTDTDMNGQTEIAALTGAQNVTVNGLAASVVFNNIFEPPVIPDVPEDVTVTVNITKTVENLGSEQLVPIGFNFALTNVETGEVLKQQSDQNGLAAFDLTYTATDAGCEYRYTLAEINDGREHVTYDTKVYEIVVKVSLDELTNTLYTGVTVNGQQAETISLSFVNTFNYTPDTPAPPTGDSTNRVFWMVMMALSGAAIVVLLIRRPAKAC